MAHSTTASILALTGVMVLAGCNSPSNTQAIKEHTADATATIKRDAGAVAEGIKEGLKRQGPMDVNGASATELETLPGITPKMAKGIIAGRPYEDTSQLYKKHVLTKTEFDRIRAQVVAK